jgi:hypothetical protein
MTFKTFVKDKDGKPIQGVLVTANDENTGGSFQRSTDGQGFADVAMLGSTQIGDRITLSVIDPQLRFRGLVEGDARVVTAEDKIVEVVLVPFV